MLLTSHLFRRWVLLFATLAVMVGISPRARGDDAGLAAYYLAFEGDARAEWDGLSKTTELSAISNEAAAKISTARLSIYNRTVFRVLCAERSTRATQMGDIAEIDRCFTGKMDELGKFLAFEKDADATGLEKVAPCKIKARNHSDELRFPPYDFLRDATGPMLFDFDALNRCILGGR